jgi:ankyrin repeat protein
MAACWRNPDPEVLTALLAAGADTSARDNAGHTALMWAAMFNENPETIRKLLEVGIDAKIKDKTGKTALDYLPANAGLRGTDAERRLQEASR